MLMLPCCFFNRARNRSAPWWPISRQHNSGMLRISNDLQSVLLIVLQRRTESSLIKNIPRRLN